MRNHFPQNSSIKWTLTGAPQAKGVPIYTLNTMGKNVRERDFLESFLISLIIGIVSGLGAVVFRGLIALLHNLLLLGKFSVSYNANVHIPASPWGTFIILIPVLASLGVTLLVTRFAPEAKGHGVPEVMESVYYHKGAIRPVVVWVKSLASALSIGSGGSVGREGPIIQIGAAVGSWIGQILKVPPWKRITWLACGAGGGIAATFNTPIGGVLFATEIILHEVSVKTLVPVVISTATASYVGRMIFGPNPSFVIPALEQPYFKLTDLAILPAYLVLGLLAGLTSVFFIRSIYWSEDFFSLRIKNHPYLRHALGMLGVGVLMDLFLSFSGHYYIEGVSYSTIQDLLSNQRFSIVFLFLLFMAKLIATSLTLGSGASGGIFSPSLFLGATLGGAYGSMIRWLWPGLSVSSIAFAVVGMAGLVAGATGAAVTAVVMIFEMTRDYSVIIPMTLTVAMSYGLRKLIWQQSIYTMKLERRGQLVPDAFHANIFIVKRAKDLMETNFTRISSEETLVSFVSDLKQMKSSHWFLTCQKGQVEGILTPEAALMASVLSSPVDRSRVTLGQIADSHFSIVSENVSLSELLALFRSVKAPTHIVVVQRSSGAAQDICGVIPKDRIADALINESEIFSSD